MESKKPSCPVCGGSEYFEDQGFYYCKDCQTQSQDIREEVHEYSFFNTTLQGNVSTVQKSPNLAQNRTNEEDEWTSWELYNFVLKGMVDELITLGASQEIKVVVLQLWTKYLRLLEIAFISKKNDLCMPKLSFPFHQRDARIVYEHTKRIRRKKRKRKARNEVEDNLSSSSPATTVRKVKKAFLRAEYEKSFSEMETDAASLLNESLNTSALEASSSVKRFSKKYLNRGVKNEYLQKKGKKSRYSNNIHVRCQLTRKTLIAILYIALLILEEKIQLSDLIRWIEEGELSYYEVTHFFPDGQKLKDQDVITFGIVSQRLTHFGVRGFANDMLIFLRINSIKLPELLPLASRYIEELQLPAEILSLVEELICVAPPSLEWNPNSKSARAAVPNTEGLVMGFIIVVLKLLMGLDGKTEYKQSEVAERVNRILEKSFPSVKLFVWNDWVKYIECRKSVLAAHHCSTHNAFFQQSSLENGTYNEFWNKMKTKDIKRKDRFILGAGTKMNPSLVGAMKTVLEKLQQEDAISTPKFVSSLTPLKNNLEVVLTSELGTNQFSSKTFSILQQDFTETTLNYLLDPKPYVGLAHKHGINITVSHKSAQENVIFEDRKFKYVVDLRRGNDIRITNKSENQTKLHKERNSSLLGDGYLDIDGSDDSDDIYSLRESDEDDMFQASTAYKTLPIVAENILLKYLGNNTHGSSVEQKTKSGKKSKRNEHGIQSEGKAYYTLYMPYSEYWVTKITNLKYFIKEFEESISSTFPSSFRWLLNQCASVLHMTTEDLYSAVLYIENMHLYALDLHGKRPLHREMKQFCSHLKKKW